MRPPGPIRCRAGILLVLSSAVAVACCALAAAERGSAPKGAIRPGHPTWPRVWVTHRRMGTIEQDVAALRAAGVGLIEARGRNAAEARAELDLARKTGMKYHLSLPDITEHRGLVRQAGLEPVDALMIGGVYDGKAIDRHVYRFTAARHEIVIEPPVYNRRYAYTRGSGGTGRPKATERIAHYFPDIGPPVRAEVVVPLKRFDGRQHLKIVPAKVAPAPLGAAVPNDSAAKLPDTTEKASRKLYRLTFDLTGLDAALLDRVGIAVYWAYGGSRQYWMFARGNVSAWADSTRQALRARVRKTLQPWIEAGGGRFPNDVVPAARYGDECFYITGHLNGRACSYPLWDYSKPAIEAFRRRAGRIEYPRTWGFPEVYGPEACAWWLYVLHEGCARLCGVVRDEIAKVAPGLMLFRNQTRMGVFHPSNDHDGSGQELLAANLDIVHLDPYPVHAGGYGACIPRDVSYCGGLARRYGRALVPWMQAHIYGGPGGLQHVSRTDVDRMADEQWAQGVDAIMWLGWGRGFTFPATRPESWKRAVAFHKRLAASAPPKPKARLAVLRSYRAWAMSSRCDGKVRNPADWMLQQLLEVWSVKHARPYDVFEVPPKLTDAERRKLEAELKRYDFVVSTEPRKGAWVIGAGTEFTVVAPAAAGELRRGYEAELKRRGWLDSPARPEAPRPGG